MKLLSNLSIIRGIGYLLVFILCVNCKKDYNSTDPSQLSPESISQSEGGNLTARGPILSQTKIASQFNNIGEDYLNLWYQLGSQYVSADDNSYAYSKKLSKQRGWLLVLLQDFHFDIPPDATIENIIVSARRFKTGNGSVKDRFATLLTRNAAGNPRSSYGVHFENPDNYPPIETEVIYSQNGTGSNGGFNQDQIYQWTPVMINDPAFGVRIDNDRPVGAVVIYYDMVSITVQYYLPEVVAP